jgi:hypothetical protein
VNRVFCVTWRVLFSFLFTLLVTAQVATAHEEPLDATQMLDTLPQGNFGWAVNNIRELGTPILWSDDIPGLGAYRADNQTILLSTQLKGCSLLLQTAFLAHEATHLTDDLRPQKPHTYGHLKDVHKVGLVIWPRCMPSRPLPSGCRWQQMGKV